MPYRGHDPDQSLQEMIKDKVEDITETLAASPEYTIHAHVHTIIHTQG